MADAPYAVIFQGKVTEGSDPQTVRENLAKLFNADAARIEQMFSGKKVVIKKGLDEDAARKYRAVLTKAGAVVGIIDARKSQKTAAPKPAESAPAPAAGQFPGF